MNLRIRDLSKSRQRGRSEAHIVGNERSNSENGEEEGDSGNSDPDDLGAPDDEQEIRCTPEHPFFVRGKGWVEAKKLKAGDQLVGDQGEELEISEASISEEEANHYNFEVEDWHTYFVSETEQDAGAWVHNRCDQSLLVGEGNLSYARALVESGQIEPNKLVATVYEGRLTGAAAKNAAFLRQAGVDVRTGVDATNLKATFGAEKFGSIRWNLPHSGSRMVATNKQLLRGFFASARGQLAKGGAVNVALKNSPHYKGWRIAEQASASGFRQVSAAPFATPPGYIHAQTAKPGASVLFPQGITDFTFGI